MNISCQIIAMATPNVSEKARHNPHHSTSSISEGNMLYRNGSIVKLQIGMGVIIVYQII